MALVAHKPWGISLPPCFVLSLSTLLVLLPLVPLPCPRWWSILGKVPNEGFLIPVADTLCSFLVYSYLMWKHVSQCADSKSFLTCRIPGLYPYLLILGTWPCFLLSRGNWCGHLNPLAPFHLNLSMDPYFGSASHACQRTGSCLQGQHFHLISPPSLPRAPPLLYHLQLFSVHQLLQCLSPTSSRIHTCSILSNIVPSAFLIAALSHWPLLALLFSLSSF